MSSSPPDAQHEPPPRPTRRWSRRWIVVGVLLGFVLVVMFPHLVIIPFKLAFGWIGTLDNHLLRSPAPLMLPAAVWWTLGAAALTKAVLWGLRRFLPVDYAEESGSEERSSQGGLRRAGIGAISLMVAALAVVLIGLTVTAGPILHYSKDLGRMVGKLDADDVGVILSKAFERNMGVMLLEAFDRIDRFGRVVPRHPSTKAVNNARQLALAGRLFAQPRSGTMPTSLAELVASGDLEAFMLPALAERPLTFPPTVLIPGLKDDMPGDLPVVIRPLPQHGGHVVAFVDASVRFVPEEEWGELLTDWIPRLKAVGVEWPEFL